MSAGAGELIVMGSDCLQESADTSGVLAAPGPLHATTYVNSKRSQGAQRLGHVVRLEPARGQALAADGAQHVPAKGHARPAEHPVGVRVQEVARRAEGVI